MVTQHYSVDARVDQWNRTEVLEADSHIHSELIFANVTLTQFCNLGKQSYWGLQ